jgi:hypothetical protein
MQQKTRQSMWQVLVLVVLAEAKILENGSQPTWTVPTMFGCNAQKYGKSHAI